MPKGVEHTTILRVLNEHSALLAEHNRLLERLPEAIGDKIGFKAPSGAEPSS